MIKPRNFIESKCGERMQNIFISNILINKVRHLEGIEIPLSEDKMKPLIITGKNGSGKTSLLDAIAVFLNMITDLKELNDMPLHFSETKNDMSTNLGRVFVYYQKLKKREENHRLKMDGIRNLKQTDVAEGVWLHLNKELIDVYELHQEGKCIVAYYKAERVFYSQIPNHIEKIELEEHYSINETPRDKFIQYLLDLKMTEALAKASGKREKAIRIGEWFESLQGLLKEIFEDDSVRLNFDEDTFKFTILMEGREPFDFNTLSSGFSAILEIVVDIMLRMEKHTKKTFDYTVPGIVLIDEIETHLHLELQKKILKFLTTLFPNIQFIVSTHSPFILNSLEDAVIYDLENKILVENGLSDVPYEGIVEGYFKVDTM